MEPWWRASLIRYGLPTVKAIIFIVFLVVLQQLEGNLIYPKVVGSSSACGNLGLAAVTVAAVYGIGGNALGVPRRQRSTGSAE